MNENNNEKQQGLQLELSQEVARGEYANFAIITHGSGDFVIDFARVLPGILRHMLAAESLWHQST